MKLILATGTMSVFVFALSRLLLLMSTGYLTCALMLGETVTGAVILYGGMLVVTKSEVSRLTIGMVKSLMQTKNKKGMESVM